MRALNSNDLDSVKVGHGSYCYKRSNVFDQISLYLITLYIGIETSLSFPLSI